MSKKVSIIIVTYNCAENLEKTLISIIGQTVKIYEIVIIDGGSTSETISIIKKYKSDISYWISEPDKGIYDAMNKGIIASKAEYILYLNAGDTFYEHTTLEKIPFDENKNTDIFYGETMIADEKMNQLGLRQKKLPSNLNWKHFKRGMVVCHQSILVNKEIAPFYNLDFHYTADIEWVIKSLKSAKKIIFTNTIISIFVEGGYSNQNLKKSWIDRFIILNNHFGLFQNLLSHIVFIFEYVFISLKMIPKYRKVNL